jgi:hypothetical protein
VPLLVLPERPEPPQPFPLRLAPVFDSRYAPTSSPSACSPDTGHRAEHRRPDPLARADIESAANRPGTVAHGFKSDPPAAVTRRGVAQADAVVRDGQAQFPALGTKVDDDRFGLPVSNRVAVRLLRNPVKVRRDRVVVHEHYVLADQRARHVEHRIGL